MVLKAYFTLLLRKVLYIHNQKHNNVWSIWQNEKKVEEIQGNIIELTPTELIEEMLKQKLS